MRAYCLVVFLVLEGTQLHVPNRQAIAVVVEVAPCALHGKTIQYVVYWSLLDYI